MSAVGYEGHIWEELFGGLSFRKVALIILMALGLIILGIVYLLLK